MNNDKISIRKWRKRISNWNFWIRKRNNSSFRITLDWIKKFPTCIYCDVELVPANAGLDHIFPIVKGGKDQEFNLRIICKNCNSTKSSLTHDQFLTLIACLSKSPFTKEDKDMIFRKLRASGMVR